MTRDWQTENELIRLEWLAEALETCLLQVANDLDIVAKYLRSEVCDNDTDIQMAEMLEQSAAAAREVATNDSEGQ